MKREPSENENTKNRNSLAMVYRLYIYCRMQTPSQIENPLSSLKSLRNKQLISFQRKEVFIITPFVLNNPF